ncbi:MAG: transketolase [Ignavibacterium sp.]
MGIEQLAINTIRCLSMDAVQKANSGHPGMPMGCAPILFTLYTKFLKHNPENPNWLNRDRFVLSAGHGSMLLYSILHLTGYKISIEDIKNFRQWGSITPGHPEYGLTPGVETTTGPLGQGFANAVGMAVAQAFLASKFNKDDIKIIDHFIYGICSDGDLMEGISHEAASFAGHNKLGKIIFFYDNNGITIDGKTSLSFSENISLRFESYGWHIQNIDDVNDLTSIERAIVNAQKDERPSLIITKTHIGFGSPNKQDSESSHGSPLGEEEVKLTKKNLGWKFDEPFLIPDEVKKYFNGLKSKFKSYEEEWKNLFSEYEKKYSSETKLFLDLMNKKFSEEWKNNLPYFEDDEKKIATRQASGRVINSIAKYLPTLIGGSADLTPSNNTQIKNEENFSSQNYSGRNFHFGIREHAMGSICNGIALYGGIIPYAGTFLVFADYMRPAIRLASLMKLKVIYIFTHDSIGLGEDGPTHQPIEHLASLRAIPNLIVIRPADANETVQAWKIALEIINHPVALILSRQSLPILDQKKFNSAEDLNKGAYILKDFGNEPEIILMASGSEVSLVIQSAENLFKEGINSRIVSFPSWELFEMQSIEYKEKVLPSKIKARISIEAGISQGWEKYIGDFGKSISIETFGASAPEKILFEKFGFTVNKICETAKLVLEKVNLIF